MAVNTLKHRRIITENLILSLFFFSGASGLIYETAWTRLLSQIYGNTVYAVSTILAAFMAGLALGSFLFGKWIDTRKNIIRFYAFLELGIGLFAFISPSLLGNINPVYMWAYQHFVSSRTFYLISLFLITFSILLIPTILMGGTLPVLSKFFVKQKEVLGHKIGNLYSFNTFGAMLGCFATGFLLIGTIGIKWTIYSAAFLNLSIFFVLLIFTQYLPLAKAKDQPEENNERKIKNPWRPNGTVLLILGAFSLSGFAALGYEVVWFRGLVFYLGNSTWAFTTMLTIFLAGLAFGSLLIRKTCDNKENLLELFGWVELTIGLTAALTILFLGGLFNLNTIFAFIGKLSRHWLTKIGGIFVVSLSVMFIPTLLMGATFPLVSKICIRDLKNVGGKMGVIYSANTVGAILGSIIGGFVLIPIIGILKSILLLSMINIIVGWIVLFFNRDLSPRYKYITSLSLLGFIILSYTIFPTTAKFRSEFEDKNDKTLFYSEDAVATTKVFQKPSGIKLMSIDGHTIGGTEYNIDKKQKLLAHLPLLLARNPKTEFVVGLGTGITLGSIELYKGLEQIRVAEIVPGAIKGSKYFSPENRDALKDPRVTVIEGDGVNYLKNTTESYDIISSDAKLNPEYVGNTIVLSEDYYKICLKRLKNEGIMCQWIPFNLPENEYLSVLKTFSSVFPHTMLWYFGWTESLLLGSKMKLTFDFKALKEKMKNFDIRTELSKFNLDNPFVLLSKFVCDEEKVKLYSQNAAINSWNRPYIEFHAPMDFTLQQPRGALAKRLQKLTRLESEIVPHLYNLGENSKEIQKTVNDLKWYRLLTNTILTTAIKEALGDTAKFKRLYPEDVKKHIDNGRKLFEAGNYKEAIKEFKQAIAIDKNLEDSYNFLSAAYTKIGRLEDACKTFQKLINLQPKNHTAHYNLGVIYHRMGMYDEELSEYKKALKFQPDYSPALYNMGIWYGNNGMYDEAVDAFEKLVAVDPNNVQARYYLAIAFMKKNQYDEARFQFSKAVEIDPKFESARQGLKAVEKLTDKKEINKERLRLSHILVSTRSEAEKILRLLKQGQSFAELAKRKSIDRTSGVKGGDLGFFEKGDLLPELEDVVFNLKVGQISGIVKSRLGYHIFKRTK